MDLSGTQALHDAAPAVILARLQAEIEAEIGLTVSIGLAPNKFLAKIASDLDKPRGFSVIGAAEAKAFLAGKPVGMLPGVGPGMVKALTAAGYQTIGDVARADPKRLAERFGASGLRLARLAHGEDVRPVDPDQIRKTISAETTFNDDLSRLDDLRAMLGPLCERVVRQARAGGVAGRVVTLKLRTPDFRIITRRRTLPAPTQTTRTLFKAACELLEAEAKGGAYRLIGAGLTDFVDEGSADSDLFTDETRVLKGERAVDALRTRFGAGAVVRARALKSRGEQG
jgi:DNA polymerase-4